MQAPENVLELSLGIDLGTTNTCVAHFDPNDGKVKIIANNLGEHTTPSVVTFAGDKVIVGKEALTTGMFTVGNTFYDVKRLIGRRSGEVKPQDLRRWTFEVCEDGDKDKTRLVVPDWNGRRQLYWPEQISALLLWEVKQMAEKYFGGRTVRKAVVTVPAYFNNSQRQATKDAAHIAGFEVLRILNEPTAAALAYGLEKRKAVDDDKEKHILVFDLGGGTFDVTILRIVDNFFDVLTTAGDVNLGGENFDDVLEQHFAEQFGAGRLDKKARWRLRKACEAAKRELAGAEETNIEVVDLVGRHTFKGRLTRTLFERLTTDLVEVTIGHVQKAIDDAKLTKADIDEVVLIGGSTRMPLVQRKLQQFFDGRELCRSINADEAVAMGAAYQAALLTGQQLRAAGSSSMDAVRIRDVTPMALGTIVAGGRMSEIVPKGSRLPLRMTKTYSPSSANQTKIVFALFQGDAPMASDNLLLGTLELDIPRGQDRKYEVIVEIDENGILRAIGRHLATGNAVHLTIADYGHLPAAETQQMTTDTDRIKQQQDEEACRRRTRIAFEESVLTTKRNIMSERVPLSSGVAKAGVLQELETLLDWITDNHKETKQVFEQKEAEFTRNCDSWIGASPPGAEITTLVNIE